MLDENQEEVEIKESIDYNESEYRFELGADRSGQDYSKDDISALGYGTKELDESGELVDAEDDFDESEDYADDFVESFDGNVTMEDE